jgi:hypothetical protein
LPVTPATAKAWVDGAPVRVQDGAILLQGHPGQVRSVRVSADGATTEQAVVLAKEGPVPAVVRLQGDGDGKSGAQLASPPRPPGTRRGDDLGIVTEFE